MAIITICRGTYTGGKVLAERLAEDLGYMLLSREEVLARSAGCFGASEEHLKASLQQKPGFLEGRGLKRRQYLLCVQASMARAVQGDDAVYHGQAGHLLLKGIPHHLRIRVVADMEYRIRAALAEGVPTRERAVQNIEELDRTRAGWIKAVHGVDINDPNTYDMIINLEQMSIETAAAVVRPAVDQAFRTTPASRKMMDDLVLASEVRARVGLDRSISDERLRIEADDGIITIFANVRSLAEAERAKELVQKLADVREVRTDIGTRW